MSYCPEDGAKMVQVCTHYNACYHCPRCGEHWSYVDGDYSPNHVENCPVHHGCIGCQDPDGLVYCHVYCQEVAPAECPEEHDACWIIRSEDGP